MDDLIRRGALLAAMGLETATKWGNKSAEQQHNSYSTWMSYEIADEINATPSVDAVEVVRCAACFEFDDGTCKRLRLRREDNDYCSYGARMDAQTDQRPETGEDKQDG